MVPNISCWFHSNVGVGRLQLKQNRVTIGSQRAVSLVSSQERGVIERAFAVRVSMLLGDVCLCQRMDLHKNIGTYCTFVHLLEVRVGGYHVDVRHSPTWVLVFLL